MKLLRGAGALLPLLLMPFPISINATWSCTALLFTNSAGLLPRLMQMNAKHIQKCPLQAALGISPPLKKVISVDAKSQKGWRKGLVEGLCGLQRVRREVGYLQRRMHAYGDVTLVASRRSPRASEVTLRMLSLEHYHPPGAQKVLPKLYTLSFKQAREVQGGGSQIQTSLNCFN